MVYGCSLQIFWERKPYARIAKPMRQPDSRCLADATSRRSGGSGAPCCRNARQGASSRPCNTMFADFASVWIHKIFRIP